MEFFLSALKIYKDVEELSDTEVIMGVQLLLYNVTAEWRQGVKNTINNQIGQNFALLKPAYLLYREITYINQVVTETTENLVSKKRKILAMLPSPKNWI